MNPEQHLIYIIKDGATALIETYKGGALHTNAGIEEIAAALISQAEAKISRLGNGHYLVTNSPYIAEKYSLQLLL